MKNSPKDSRVRNGHASAKKSHWIKLSVFLIAICLLMSQLPTNLSAADAQVIVSMTPRDPAVSAGRAAEFDLAINISGSTTKYEDVEIIVQFPSGTTLSAPDDFGILNLFGVTPNYDEVQNQLVYQVSSVRGGSIARTKLFMLTENLYTPDGTVKQVDVTVRAGGNTYTADASVTVNASGKVLTAFYCDYAPSDLHGTRNRFGQYGVRIEVPYYTASGDLALDKTKKMRVEVRSSVDNNLAKVLSLGGGATVIPAAPGELYDIFCWEWDISLFGVLDDRPLFTWFSFSIEYPVLPPDQTADLHFDLQVTVPFIGGVEVVTERKVVEHKIGGPVYPGEGSPATHLVAEKDPSTLRGSSQPPLDMLVGDSFDLHYGLTCFPMVTSTLIEGFYVETKLDPNRMKFNYFDTGVFWATNMRDVVVELGFFDVAVALDEAMTVWRSAFVQRETIITRSDLGVGPDTPIYGVRMTVGPTFAFCPPASDRPRINITLVGDIPDALESHHIDSTFEFWLWEAIYGMDSPYNDFAPDGAWRFHYEDGLGYAYGGAEGTTLLTTHDSNDMEAHLNILPDPQTPPAVKVNMWLADTPTAVVESGVYSLKYEFQNLTASDVTGRWGYLMNPTGAVLLPQGVRVVAGSETLFGSMTVHDNFDGARQLLVFDFDADFLSPGISALAEVRVTIASDVNTPLEFAAYGLYTNTIVEVPTLSVAGVIEDSVIVPNALRAATGNAGETMVRAGNRYVYGYQSGLFARMSVRGGYDEAFSLVGLSAKKSPLNYKLTVENRTSCALPNVMIMNILPDTDSPTPGGEQMQDSQWRAELTGPIALPSGYAIRYSLSDNPDRGELFAAAVYPDGVTKADLIPADTQEPNWLTAAQVTDWSAIRSFIITADAGTLLEVGQALEVEYQATVGADFAYTPTGLDLEQNYADACAYQLAVNADNDTTGDITDVLSGEGAGLHPAWNTFAVQAGALPVTETMRAGALIVSGLQRPTATFEGTKTVSGTGATARAFTFIATEIDTENAAIGEPYTVSLQGAGTFAFQTRPLAIGSHTFRVVEQLAQEPHWQYDETVFLVTFDVEYDQEANEYRVTRTDRTAILFDNVYEAPAVIVSPTPTPVESTPTLPESVPTPTPQHEAAPPTGDAFDILFVLALMVACAIVAGGCMVRRNSLR